MAKDQLLSYNAGVVTALHFINKTDEQWMALAITQAAQAMASGEVPVGAVAVFNGQVIAEGHNVKEAAQDPTAHAEMVVLRQAAQALGNWRLVGVTLFSTLEPCPMCAGAMIQARLERLVYGAKDIRFGADGSVIDVLAQPRFNHRVLVTSGVMEDESAALMQTFFRQLRPQK